MALEVSRVLAGAHDDPILCVAYNAVRREFWTGCQGGKIRCWEEKTGEMVQEVSGAHKGWVTAMEYLRRHDYLVTCGVDGLGKQWLLLAMKILVDFNKLSHDAFVTCNYFSWRLVLV